jgi:hypothetical protein
VKFKYRKAYFRFNPVDLGKYDLSDIAVQKELIDKTKRYADKHINEIRDAAERLLP